MSTEPTEATRATQQILQPEVLAKLSHVELVARLVVEGLMTGIHRSPHKGFSVEFADHREYVPGDDLRFLDWIVYAKTDNYYIQQFEGETNARMYLLLDSSGSMTYGREGVLSKFRYAQCLAASLAFLMIRQRDSCGLVTFDEQMREYIPPRGVASHLHYLLNTLQNTVPGGETDVSQIFHSVAEKIRRRGLVVIISDLFDDTEEILNALVHFRHYKHEVLVFHVMDPDEIEFPFDKYATFEDIEEGYRLNLDPRVLRKEYRKEVDQFIQTLRLRCGAHDIQYVLLNTQVPFDQALLAYLSKRTRLG